LYTIDKSKQCIIYAADVTSMALCGFLVLTRTDINEFFSTSRNFCSGLAYSRLTLSYAAIFTAGSS